jgi:hypothetical protein
VSPLHWQAFRGGLLRPSRPGEFHPEPLTDPDLTLSRHPARATARRLPSSRCGPPALSGRWSNAGSPRFRRDPFARDVLFDPGRVDSTSHNDTAHVAFGSKGQPPPPAKRVFRGSRPHPTQPLCTLRVRRRRRLTQHSLPDGLLGLTWAGLAPADRDSFAWRLHLLDHLVGAAKQCEWS